MPNTQETGGEKRTGWQRQLIALNRTITPFMFVLAAVLLFCLHDNLRLTRQIRSEVFAPLERTSFWVMLGICPLFLIEALLYFTGRLPGARSYFFAALCPPLRFRQKELDFNQQIWIPTLGWSETDRRTAKEISSRVTVCEFAFSVSVVVLLIVAASIPREASYLEIVTTPSVEWVFGCMWVMIVAEVMTLSAVFPIRKRLFSQYRAQLFIMLSPVLPLLRIAHVARIIRQIQTWDSSRSWVIRDPEKRLELLEKELQQHQVEVEQLRAQVATEREFMAAKKSSKRN